MLGGPSGGAASGTARRRHRLDGLPRLRRRRYAVEVRPLRPTVEGSVGGPAEVAQGDAEGVDLLVLVHPAGGGLALEEADGGEGLEERAGVLKECGLLLLGEAAGGELGGVGAQALGEVGDVLLEVGVVGRELAAGAEGGFGFAVVAGDGVGDRPGGATEAADDVFEGPAARRSTASTSTLASPSLPTTASASNASPATACARPSPSRGSPELPTAASPTSSSTRSTTGPPTSSSSRSSCWRSSRCWFRPRASTS